MTERLKEIPLTKDQRQLAADNHKLIYGYAYKNDLDLDEYYDILAIGLCLAAQGYDPTKGSAFSTYAYSAMTNEVIRYWRLKARAKEIPKSVTTSIQKVINPSDGENDEIGEKILYDEKVQSPDISRIEVSEFLMGLNETQRQIVLYLLEGYTHREIGKMLGVTGSYIGQLKLGIIQRYYMFIGRGDIAYAMKNTKRMVRNRMWGKK